MAYLEPCKYRSKDNGSDNCHKHPPQYHSLESYRRHYPASDDKRTASRPHRCSMHATDGQPTPLWAAPLPPPHKEPGGANWSYSPRHHPPTRCALFRHRPDRARRESLTHLSRQPTPAPRASVPALRYGFPATWSDARTALTFYPPSRTWSAFYIRFG